MKISFDKLKKLDFRSNEAYKTLRTNISFCGDDVRVIAFTSSTPNEGKSVVSLRIAEAFGEDEKKVLFIDADIRKSVLLSRYGADQESKGLTHYLAGKSNLDEVIYETSIRNVDMIFTGPVAPNPSELLGNSKFAKLIETAREKYDYVILDCPPIGSVIDAAVIAKQCDGVIIVVESNNISYKMVQKVKAQLEKSGCRILGAVLNKVEIGGKGYGYGKYYGRYYSKYYGKHYGSYYGDDYYGKTEK